MAGQNRGYFIPTTQSYDLSELYQTDVSSTKFKEFIIRLYQQMNLVAEQLNQRGSGLYNTQEFATGETFFPSTGLTSGSATKITPRSVFRKVLNFGSLPNTTTKSSAHGLTLNSTSTLVKLYGAATNTAGTSFIPIPYASATAASVIELNADGTNINIVTGSDRTSYTKCVVIIEFLKN